jgi:diadenosine tetraphosphate (Ap4A) HIT family hydrolase
VSAPAPARSADSGCVLCDSEGGALVYANERLRVIHASEAGFPAFYRVIWQTHVAEFSDLNPQDRAHCMHAVVQVEEVLRAELAPTKINLAALGNMVPHLHWHVVARFDWDSHFPAPVWAAPLRAVDDAKVAAVESHTRQIHSQIARRLAS